MTRTQYNNELEKTAELEKVYGEDSNMIKNRLEWLATVEIEDEQEDVDDMDFGSLYKEAFKIVTENTATEILLDVSNSILGIAEWFLTLAITFGPIILLFKLIF